MLNTGKLAGKTIYITGASRGIGKAIALKAAKDGAKIVVAAKTDKPHPKLPGTIYTAAKEIEEAGGEALPLVVDVRDEALVQASIEKTVNHFGGIDIVINNASAISLTGTQDTPMKKFDLMHSINTRGTFLVSKCALPYLKISKKNPHILNISPPLSLNPRWFENHVAYTMAKYGMSMCVLGMSREFKSSNIAVNALWPKTAIITAAMEMLGGQDISKRCRTPQIMADAAYVVLGRDSNYFTGNFAIDEEILKEEGCRDFDQYAFVSGTKDFLPDFFLDEFLEEVDRGSEPSTKTKATITTEAATASFGGKHKAEIQKVFDKINERINQELVSKTQAVYLFKVSGENWFLDLKNGSGSFGAGEPSVAPDCTLIMEKDDFKSMFKGQLKPAAAFMSGKLKLEGNMSKAMALEKVMKRSYHTLSSSASSSSKVSTTTSVRNYTDAGPHYTEVPQVFERIQEVANKEIVEKVDAVYIFNIEGIGKYYVDLKTGEGKVGSGDLEDEEKADVTISMSQANFLKMFNRELKPATAFMTGKLKLSGDLSKAMALEAVMKASRGETSFHTSACNFGRYGSVDEVIKRIGSIANPEIIGKVNAVYVFDVKEEGKYFVDFKNGDGEVGTGDPPNGKQDVTLTMTKENFLKLFNRELAPASAFMTGKLKVSGDLTKALTLEAVMKAAAEARDADETKK